MPYFNLHTHKINHSENVTSLVNQYPWEFTEGVPFYSIGIHPWHIDTTRLETDLHIIEQKLNQPNCLAVGECGLDKRIDIPMETQISVFRRQIILAEKYQKPLILHLVAAFDELIAIKKEQNIQVPIIIHGFSKNLALAQQLLQNGLYLSFGKYLLRNPELSNVFEAVPDNRIFLETDTMEETIEAVFEKAASAKNISVEQLQTQIATNWKYVFR